MANRLTLVTVALVMLVDQTTKAVAIARDIDLGWFDPVTNPEAFLGIVGGDRLTLLGLGVVALIAFGAHLGHLARSGLPGWVAGLLIGGAVSNLADRALFGMVRDFIRLPGMTVNMADIALVAGVFGLMAYHLSSRRRRRQASLPESAQVSAEGPVSTVAGLTPTRTRNGWSDRT